MSREQGGDKAASDSVPGTEYSYSYIPTVPTLWSAGHRLDPMGHLLATLIHVMYKALLLRGVM